VYYSTKLHKQNNCININISHSNYKIGRMLY